VTINSLLEYDEFRLVEADYSLVGQRSGRKFRMGDKVWIKVIAANLTKRQLDYEWVVAGEVGKEKRAKEKLKKKKS
jgi:ribonuclease R